MHPPCPLPARSAQPSEEEQRWDVDISQGLADFLRGAAGRAGVERWWEQLEESSSEGSEGGGGRGGAGAGGHARQRGRQRGQQHGPQRLWQQQRGRQQRDARAGGAGGGGGGSRAAAAVAEARAAAERQQAQERRAAQQQQQQQEAPQPSPFGRLERLGLASPGQQPQPQCNACGGFGHTASQCPDW